MPTRIIVTLFAAVVLLAGRLVPLIGADRALAPEELQRPPTFLYFGLVPFVSAFTLVEVIALVVPPLRRRRVGNTRERAPLDLASWVLSLVFVAVQSFSTSRFLESVAEDERWFPPLPSMVAQHVAAHALMLGLMVLVTRRGLLNGFVLALFCEAFVVVFANLARMASVGLPTPGMVLVLFLFVAAFVTLSRHSRRSDPSGPSAVPFPAAGLLPWVFAGALLSLPSTLSVWLPSFEGLARELMYSPSFYGTVNALLMTLLTALFGWLFFRPRAVGELWARWMKADATAASARAARLLPKALVLNAAVLVASQLVRDALMADLASFLMQLLVAAFIVTDVVDELRWRRTHGDAVFVRSLHRVAEVEPVLAMFQQTGIPCFARSVGLRALNHFFAPYVPMELFVPGARVDEARRALGEG